jgi:hypothetical protein
VQILGLVPHEMIKGIRLPESPLIPSASLMRVAENCFHDLH